MINLFKKFAIILTAFFAFIDGDAQGTKILSIDSINNIEPIIMNDSTNFFVIVSVNDTSIANEDSIYGDLFYYYQTDSMFNALVPPRVINNDITSIYIVDSINDIVSIDIRPDEIRTTPVNLIIVWPAMINPEVLDTFPREIYVGFDGYMGWPPLPNGEKKNLIFPCPALQYIYIRQEELSLIKQIRILSVEGKMISQYENSEFSNGFINLDYLASGNYLVELQYFDSKIIQTKILKRQ